MAFSLFRFIGGGGSGGGVSDGAENGGAEDGKNLTECRRDGSLAFSFYWWLWWWWS